MSTSGILHPSIDYLRRPGKLRPQVLRRVGNVCQEIGQTAKGPLQSRACHRNGYEVDRTYQMRWPMKRGWGYSNVSLRKVISPFANILLSRSESWRETSVQGWTVMLQRNLGSNLSFRAVGHCKGAPGM